MMEVKVTKTTNPKVKPDPATVPFGVAFTDHMFMMDYDSENGWQNPRIVPFGDISLNPGALVFHYGAEVFEGLKAYRTPNGEVQMFRPAENFKRMNNSAERLCLPQFDVDDAVEYLRKFVEVEKDWVPDQYGTSLYLRPFLFGTDADLALVETMLNNPEVEGKVVFPYGVPQKGDILYKDLNGDGLVNDDDRTVIGNGKNPTFTYGVNLGFNWKGIDFSTLIQGVAGIKDVYLSNLYKSGVRQGYQMNQEVIDGRWYEGRTDASYPRLLDYSDTRNEQYSDFWVASKAYLKIRNITLGYTLPSQWTKVAYMDRVRVYGSLENFFTFSKWKGYDPEVSGVTYPTMRQAVIGINVTF